MKSAQELDLLEVNSMSALEFAQHCIAVCIRPMSDSQEWVIDRIDGSGYSSREELKAEVMRAFEALGASGLAAATDAERLIQMMLSEEIQGDVWHVRLERAKTIVLVKANAAVAFPLSEILRRVHADALSQSQQDRALESAGANALHAAAH